jgi:hypothetical protein
MTADNLFRSPNNYSRLLLARAEPKPLSMMSNRLVIGTCLSGDSKTEKPLDMHAEAESESRLVVIHHSTNERGGRKEEKNHNKTKKNV